MYSLCILTVLNCCEPILFPTKRICGKHCCVNLGKTAAILQNNSAIKQFLFMCFNSLFVLFCFVIFVTLKPS